MANGGSVSPEMLVASSQKRLAAISLTRRPPMTNRVEQDILVVTVPQGKEVFRLADGKYNAGLAFSPDDRYLAFFASNSDWVENRPPAPAGFMACRLANLRRRLAAVLAVRRSSEQSDRLELHGLWTCVSDPELADYEYKAPGGADFMWLAVPPELSTRANGKAPRMLGILELTRDRMLRVVRPAQRRPIEGRARVEIPHRAPATRLSLALNAVPLPTRARCATVDDVSEPMQLSGWARHPWQRTNLECSEALEAASASARLSRGLGRAYGDAALPATVDTWCRPPHRRPRPRFR